ncbi:GNAT family N-acetyltransferase [Chloroflexus sp.]|uniref:GNAT family N-acetyltransferase n=1 Tax=Chloroflexus sp. TaxID=1904827 RepID=UPI002603E997|nr:GNAT family N-acetyltransferase [uncultured Chloroflexus sp.]
MNDMRLIRSVDPQLWWEVARACPYATFFHTPRWSEIACQAIESVRDRTIAAIFSNGTRAVLPLLEIRRAGPFSALISTFEGCYGGIIADGPLSQGDAARLYRQVYRWNVSNFYYLANPLAPPETIDRAHYFADEVSHILHLNADFEEIFNRFDKSTRAHYRRGLREGVRIRRAMSETDYKAYYRAYREAVKRWGQDSNYGYSWEFLNHVFSFERRYSDELTLWVVELDGNVVGGTLAFYWNQHVTVWHGTVTDAALKRRAMVVLDVEIARDAAARGFRYYDFNTSAGIEGVMNYKRNFATTDYAVARCRYRSPIARPLLALKDSLHRRLRSQESSAQPQLEWHT